MRVLITGASGHIGSLVAAGLADEHEITGLDLRAPETAFPGDFSVGDCADSAVAARAVDGVDAVVHLAGVPTESDLPTIMHSHVETTAALLDAMVQCGARRMVYASSNHAVGMTPREEVLGVDVPPRPDTFYGVGKVAAEALLSLYADRHGISSVAMRIGSCLPAPTTRRELSTWLSYEDCVRMVRAALTADRAGVAVVYGISANRDAWWDLAPGRSIGYEPLDDASLLSASVLRRPDDEAEAARVGGPFATDQLARRPFAEAAGEREQA